MNAQEFLEIFDPNQFAFVDREVIQYFARSAIGEARIRATDRRGRVAGRMADETINTLFIDESQLFFRERMSNFLQSQRRIV